jgi:hypothetical protein
VELLSIDGSLIPIMNFLAHSLPLPLNVYRSYRYFQYLDPVAKKSRFILLPPGGFFSPLTSPRPSRSPKMSPCHSLYLRPNVVLLHLRLFHTARAAPHLIPHSPRAALLLLSLALGALCAHAPFYELFTLRRLRPHCIPPLSSRSISQHNASAAGGPCFPIWRIRARITAELLLVRPRKSEASWRNCRSRSAFSSARVTA